MHALTGKFLDAQENNTNLHNYLNARNKWDYLPLCANKTVHEDYCFKSVKIRTKLSELKGQFPPK